MLQAFIASHPEGDWLKWQDADLILCCVTALIYTSGIFTLYHRCCEQTSVINECSLAFVK